MNMASRFGALATVACLVTAGVASAQLVHESIGGRGADVVTTPDYGNGKTPAPSSVEALTTVYDNTASAPNFGFSSTDLAATWGDELFLAGTGLLSTNKFTVFNGSSAGALLTATVGVSFYNATTSALLGAYSTNINFGAGLNPGFFATVTVTGLDPLLIILNTTDIIVTQTVLAKTGPATRLGIASLNPPTVGSSPNTMFIAASTVGPPGFYNVGNPPVPANPGYMIGVNDPPVGARHTSWGRIKGMYR